MARKTTLRGAYVAKREAEATGVGKDKPFGGSTINGAHEQLRWISNKVSTVLAPLTNQILDSLKGYLNNIYTAATQAVTKGGPLVELSANLAISIDTVGAQQN